MIVNYHLERLPGMCMNMGCNDSAAFWKVYVKCRSAENRGKTG